jgi:hypothetical protein
MGEHLTARDCFASLAMTALLSCDSLALYGYE